MNYNKNSIRIAFLLIVITIKTVCSQPYLNPDLTINQRVDDLISRMTLEEKVGQMTQYVAFKHIQGVSGVAQLDDIENVNSDNEFYPGLKIADIKEKIKKGEIGSFLLVKGLDEANYLQKLAAESRLKIPLLIGEDAIHGHALYSGATVYPTPLALASSFNKELVKNIARATAKEMRLTGYHWTFSPNVDVAKDARWGRTGETFGEDPLLVGEMGKAMVEGYQENLKNEGVLSCLKHFIAGSQPSRGLNFTPMDASQRAMKEIWLPPYEKSIKAGAKTVMAAHHDLNGVPCHANDYLLTDILRNEWDFDGFVVSDWKDVFRLQTLHKVAENLEQAASLSVNAGLDMNMHGPGFHEYVVKNVEKGIIDLSRVDQAVKAILTSKFELGLFEKVLVDEENEKKLFDEESRDLAYKAALESMVLLENKGNILPLDTKKYKNIFITGPNANNQTLLGDWAGKQPDDNVVTILEGVRNGFKNSNVTYYECEDHRSISDEDIDKVKYKASEADVSIVVVGDNSFRTYWNSRTNGENSDRADVSLFGRQLDLVKAAHASGKPVIVILVIGKPTAIPWIKENIPGVLVAWETGAFSGTAVSDILLGKYNPSGKLPISFPRSSGQLPVFYNHRPSSYYRTYNDEETGALYGFGYGLNYSNVVFSNLSVPENIEKNKLIKINVEVKNNGYLPIDETVLLFFRDNFSSVTTPVKSLLAFQRTYLNANESKQVFFEIPYESLALLNKDMVWEVENGEFTFFIDKLNAVSRY
ncbi:glycoside hydrolase family 3 N-terminal domain-containing protein [Wocania ichthyoenteri]|uniref:glycoside hydrolase family 3 N-terminal domain-containing protein n=1 Tax=Wocania ichthyoenteri TaxID=1230531 RepID=UPI00053D2362|nr:glycoside hydrolase family 3 N-terminal domain-containing protein [Wocania ichthyoenteri]